MRLAIFGTGGMGRELYDIASVLGRESVFVVDQPDGPVLGIRVLSPDDLEDADELIFALGSSKHRRTLADRFDRRRIATVIARTAVVSPSAEVGQGAVLCDYAVVNNSAKIGKHFQGNVFSQVSHDCIIGDYVTLSPKASVNGWVEIGDDVFVGAGAVIRNGDPGRWLKIGKGTTIGMGAVVTKDVPPGATVIGCPARPTERT